MKMQAETLKFSITKMVTVRKVIFQVIKEYKGLESAQEGSVTYRTVLYSFQFANYILQYCSEFLMYFIYSLMVV